MITMWSTKRLSALFCGIVLAIAVIGCGSDVAEGPVQEAEPEVVEGNEDEGEEEIDQ